MKERGYQYEFSRDNAEMHSARGRQRKALTMLAVLEDALGADGLASARVLNVGCSTGLIDEILAARVATVTGIDIDGAAIELAIQRRTRGNIEFRLGDAMALDFPSAAFDVVICSQVYEHVPDPERMMAEIERVLVPEGACYFAATNRFCVMEQHYHVPFLSILPVSWAHRYLRLLGKGDHYHERHLTLWGLRRLARGFRVDDYTGKLLSEPGRYHFDYMLGSGLKAFVIRTWARLAYWAFPGYIWVLRKRASLAPGRAGSPRGPDRNEPAP